MKEGKSGLVNVREGRTDGPAGKTGRRKGTRGNRNREGRRGGQEEGEGEKIMFGRENGGTVRE